MIQRFLIIYSQLLYSKIRILSLALLLQKKLSSYLLLSFIQKLLALLVSMQNLYIAQFFYVFKLLFNSKLIIIFMKIILCALLTFYSFALTTHLQTLSFSGDSSTVITTNQIVDKSKVSLSDILKLVSQNFQKPQNWQFLKNKLFEAQSKWITPGQSLEILPLFWMTTYSIGFQSVCPKNPLKFKISATAVYKIQLDNQVIQDWTIAWPQVSQISLKGKCGSNNLKVTVFNFFYASPAAIAYTLVQDTTNCRNCPQGFVYNQGTCACLCNLKVKCLQNQVFDQNLCKCVSKCPVPLPCSKDQIWDAFNCQCICKKQPTECPGNAKLNPDTCTCFCVQNVLCIIGFQWDSNLCTCVQSPKPTHSCQDSCDCDENDQE